MEKAGMDIEDNFNKMLLPTNKGAEIYTNKRSIHQGRHLNEVKFYLEEEMNEVLRIGNEFGYTKEQYRDAISNITKKEHSALKSGKRMLNKNARLWAESIEKKTNGN